MSSVVRSGHPATPEERNNPLDIVATVKADGEVGQLAGRKCGSGCLGVARAVHAVAAIVGTQALVMSTLSSVTQRPSGVNEWQHPAWVAAQLPGLARALNPEEVRYVVLRRIGQNLQLLDDVHRATPSRRQASSGPQLFTGTLCSPE